MLSCPKCSTPCDGSHRFCHSCGASLPVLTSTEDALLGAVLPGGYVINELLAEGGMGRIYRAEQPALGRLVAVKVIHPHLAGDPEIAARFLVEARAASRLNHPNAVTVIAFGNMPLSGQPYLVMKLLEGKPLTRVNEEDGPLAFDRIVDILAQVLAALEQAHGLAIVHRDVKPDNIIVEPLHSGGDLVKVIDFGLACVLVEPADFLSTPLVGGTPAYMSPEHARGERVDGRSDLYSVGVILYELLAGRVPFVAETSADTLLAVLNDPPLDPRDHAPTRKIPVLLAEAALRSLAKDPRDRFQTAGDLVAALRGALPARSSVSEMATGSLCRACGTENTLRRPFCGECGSPMKRPKPATRE